MSHKKDIIRMIAEGQTNREIASRLGLSVRTVKNIVTKILAEYGAMDRLHLRDLLGRPA